MDAIYALPSLLLAIVFSFLLTGLLGGGIVAAALVADRHLHPAVLPRGPQHDRVDARDDLRRGRARHRGTAVGDHSQVPVRQRRPVGAGHRHPERGRRHRHPGRPRFPGPGDPAQRGLRVGLRPEPGPRRRAGRRLVARPVARTGDHRAHHGADPGRRGTQRDAQPGATAPPAAAGGRSPRGRPRPTKRWSRDRHPRRDVRPPRTSPATRCSRCATCASGTAPSAAPSAPSTASASTCTRERSWGSSGSPGCGKSTLGRGLIGLLPEGSARDGELRLPGSRHARR